MNQINFNLQKFLIYIINMDKIQKINSNTKTNKKDLLTPNALQNL